jgi:hypothetical protein
LPTFTATIFYSQSAALIAANWTAIGYSLVAAFNWTQLSADSGTIVATITQAFYSNMSALQSAHRPTIDESILSTFSSTI